MLNVTSNKKEEKDIIEQVVNLLKEHPIVKAILMKFKIDPEDITLIPIEFKDLDVSAKAKEGKIYINKSFLEEDDIIEHAHYLVHELTHILQQATGTVSKNCKDRPYLDDPSEIEAFQNQIAFIAAYKNEEEADKYVDDLLNFHDYSGKKRELKRRQLRGG